KQNARDGFAAFYTALFDATLAKHPGAVITEYAWDATTCEPCPGPTLDYAAFQALGGDVLDGTAASPTAYGSSDFVLTRMHVRYDKSVKNDLTFKEVPPIAGGREQRGPDGAVEQSAQASSYSAFQARYAIRNRWLGPLTCSNPVRGRWARKGAIQVAQDLAYAPRGTLQLADQVAQDVPELDLTIGKEPPPTTTLARSPEKESGCNCSAGGASGGLAIGVLVLLVRRRKR
ncbi:MAG TPA: MYXO-CTERM sorting domain-containing protein, partial [Kofleriaceae bacterium]|nr:MYXO-CTERM sorting domain-containing protein [Kofleriaceae bacterium]